MANTNLVMRADGPAHIEERPGAKLRLAVFLTAWVTTYALGWNYRVPLVGSEAYADLGLVWNPAPASISMAFALLAALPSLWLPLRVRAPSDMMAMLLYVTVFLPTTALLPHLSSSDTGRQFAFVSLTMVGLSMVALAGAMPVMRLPIPAVRPRRFWIGFGLLYAAILGALLASGRFSLAALTFVDVYEGRTDFFQTLSDHHWTFPYAIFLTTFAIGPFLVAYGLTVRRVLPFLAGGGLMFAAFAVSTHKTAYLGLFAVTAVWLVQRMARRRALLALLACSSAMLVLTGVIDLMREGPQSIPTASFALFRIFGNSAFLSSAYLDFFDNNPLVYLSQSVFRSFVSDPYDIPYPIAVGSAATGSPQNHANANLFADAVANFGLPGILLMSAVLAGFLWVYNSLARRHDPVFAGLLLVLPTVSLANTGVHSAMLTGGLVVSLLLCWLLPPEALERIEKTPRVNRLSPESTAV